MLITRAGLAGQIASPSPFTITVKRRLDPDDVGAAAVAVEALQSRPARTAASSPRGLTRRWRGVTGGGRGPASAAAGQGGVAAKQVAHCRPRPLQRRRMMASAPSVS